MVIAQPTSETVEGVTYHDATTAAGIGPDALDSARVQSLVDALGRADFPSGHDVVHLKGFAGGMLLGPAYEQHVRVLIAELRRRAFKALVWDGDDFDERSFTAVMPRIKRELPHLRLGAILCQHHRTSRWGNPEGFHGSWRRREGVGAIDCFLVDKGVKEGGYTALGWLGLRATRTQTAILLGGGVVAKQEFEAMLVSEQQSGSQKVEFILLDCVRQMRGQPDG
eukprot:4609879-Prymnesium_polylepis.1